MPLFKTAIARRAAPFAIAASLALLPALARADDARIKAAVDRAFRPLLQQHDVSGIAVAVTIGGRRQFFNFGVIARGGTTPVTETTLFEIGSVSKTFTATLAAYAAAEGRLTLADHPSRFMPDLAGTPIDQASLLNLGTYTAGGLPLQLPASARTLPTTIAYLRTWRPVVAPGTQRRYSNPSIGLLGHLAARAMNRPYADLIEREIAPRLGLRSTYIRVPPAEAARYAWGTDRAGRPSRAGAAVFAEEAYGVKTTATDLIAFVEANLRPERLEPTLRRAVETTQTGYFRIGETVQGLGWEQYAYPTPLARLLAGNADTMAFDPHPASALTPPARPAGPTLFNKTGSTNGFAAYAVFVPAKGIGVVMLANRNIPIPARITAAHAVLEALAAQAP